MNFGFVMHEKDAKLCTKSVSMPRAIICTETYIFA